jgi:hypothetical protein
LLCYVLEIKKLTRQSPQYGNSHGGLHHAQSFFVPNIPIVQEYHRYRRAHGAHIFSFGVVQEGISLFSLVVQKAEQWSLG